MGKIDIVMPKMGESVAEATIIRWLKEEGDKVELDEPILEIATDKVDSEIPSPEEGILSKKLFAEDDVVQIGQAIAELEVAGAGSEAETVAAKAETTVEEVKEAVKVEQAEIVEPLTSGGIPRTTESGRFYSPLVRSIAEQENVAIEELEQIPGSGLNGRVTKKDIKNYLSDRGTNGHAPVTEPKNQSQSSVATKTTQPVNITVQDGDEIIEMDRMRKLIADHMVNSKQTSPHVTSIVEVDVTNIVMWRNRVKQAFQEREGEKITYTPIFFEQIARTIKELPMINVSVDMGKNQIIKHRNINLGMATALPSGNLIVPVIKDADRMNLIGLTKSVNDLANRARNNALQPDEIQGGTFTVTNVGTFGNVMGTPIINQPQVAILALGAIRKKPAVIETPYGDTIGIRHMMFLSMSYDHRVVDGALGGSFIRQLADHLESFDPKKEF